MGVHQQCFLKVSLKKVVKLSHINSTVQKQKTEGENLSNHRFSIGQDSIIKKTVFFSNKAWFPLSRNVNCLTDTDGMDIPMMQFMKFLYMTFQFSVEYSKCTLIYRVYIFHHLFLSRLRSLAFSVFTLPTPSLDVPHLFYWEIIFEGDLRDLRSIHS
jgi:hypothetical protein